MLLHSHSNNILLNAHEKNGKGEMGIGLTLGRAEGWKIMIVIFVFIFIIRVDLIAKWESYRVRSVSLRRFDGDSLTMAQFFQSFNNRLHTNQIIDRYKRDKMTQHEEDPRTHTDKESSANERRRERQRTAINYSYM